MEGRGVPAKEKLRRSLLFAFHPRERKNKVEKESPITCIIRLVTYHKDRLTLSVDFEIHNNSFTFEILWKTAINYSNEYDWVVYFPR